MIIDYIKKTYNKGQDEFHKTAEQSMSDNQKMFIVTANPEIFMTANNNADFNKVLMDENVTIVPDGIGVIKAMQKLNISTNGRVPGVELSAYLIEAANRLGKKVCLFGAKPEVIGALVDKYAHQYPDLDIAGAFDGYIKDKDEVFDKIAELEPDVILVALGVPAQELLIARHIHKFNKGIFVGVGGSFDVLSGTKSRAPKIFIKLNLEWLYRIICEPTRFKRFWNGNVKFFSVLSKELKQIKR